jgi:hypothetical protein
MRAVIGKYSYCISIIHIIYNKVTMGYVRIIISDVVCERIHQTQLQGLSLNDNKAV